MNDAPSAEHLGSLLSAISSKHTYQVQLLATGPMPKPYYVSYYAPVGKPPTRAWEVDLPLAASLAGDLLLMPSSRVLENINAGALEDALLEAYMEVSNMLGTALNGPGKERLVLESVSLSSCEEKAPEVDLTSYVVRCGASGPWRVNLAPR